MAHLDLPFLVFQDRPALLEVLEIPCHLLGQSALVILVFLYLLGVLRDREVQFGQVLRQHPLFLLDLQAQVHQVILMDPFYLRGLGFQMYL